MSLEDRIEKLDNKLTSLERESKAKRRAILHAAFTEYASIWRDAEVANHKEALVSLKDGLRPKLRMPRTKLTLLEKLSMLARFGLTLVVTFGGAGCLLCVTPLRWLHPLLRRLGVENGKLPMDFCTRLWARSILAAAGITVILQGDAKQWKTKSGICVYNHASNLDPMVLNVACHGLSPKYIGKQVLFKLPIFGWLLVVTGQVPINRGDREKALRTMNEFVTGIMRNWGRSIAVSPEGTRTTDGHLVLPFKKGPFQLQQQTKAPFLPVACFGCFDLWPPGQLFTTEGRVVVDVLPRQDLKDGESHDDARLRLQRLYVEHMAKRGGEFPAPLSLSDRLENACVVAGTAGVFWLFRQAFIVTTSALGLSNGHLCTIFLATSVTAPFIVDKVL